MNTVTGLFLALVGLFLIWLWSSGRAEAVWQDLWTGSVQSGFTSDPGQAGPGSAGGWGLPNLSGFLPNGGGYSNLPETGSTSTSFGPGDFGNIM